MRLRRTRSVRVEKNIRALKAFSILHQASANLLALLDFCCRNDVIGMSTLRQPAFSRIDEAEAPCRSPVSNQSKSCLGACARRRQGLAIGGAVRSCIQGSASLLLCIDFVLLQVQSAVRLLRHVKNIPRLSSGISLSHRHRSSRLPMVPLTRHN